MNEGKREKEKRRQDISKTSSKREDHYEQISISHIRRCMDGDADYEGAKI